MTARFKLQDIFCTFCGSRGIWSDLDTFDHEDMMMNYYCAQCDKSMTMAGALTGEWQAKDRKDFVEFLTARS